MAVCYVLRVTAVAVVTWALGNAGSDVERLLEEDTLDLRVEPLVDLHNSSLLSGVFVGLIVLRAQVKSVVYRVVLCI